MLCFKQSLEKTYGHCYQHTDKAHDILHIREVADNALAMVDEMKIDINKEHILLAVYIHDMFSNVDRGNHHILAYNYAMKSSDIFFENIEHRDRVDIAMAVREHRASHKGGYYSIMSEVLASADRSNINLEDMIVRSYLFNINTAKYPLTPSIDIKKHDEVVFDVYKHMHEKFGRVGYVRYPELYKRWKGVELEKLYVEIDNLTLDKVDNIIKNKFNKE